MNEVFELDCGCESAYPVQRPVSWCSGHAPVMRSDPELHLSGMYRCGECGFQSERWERLERHVYQEHLGVRCG